MNVPENEKNKFTKCLKCVWNNFKGISKTIIFCSLASCKTNIEADSFKKYKKG